jgi:hypothetical protein
MGMLVLMEMEREMNVVAIVLVGAAEMKRLEVECLD